MQDEHSYKFLRLDLRILNGCTVKLKQDCLFHRGILRSRYGISVDFDKICVFCDKYCVSINKCVFIVVKIKCVNSGKIYDIYDKVNFTTNYTHFTIPEKHLSKHTQHFYQNIHKYYNF